MSLLLLLFFLVSVAILYVYLRVCVLAAATSTGAAAVAAAAAVVAAATAAEAECKRWTFAARVWYRRREAQYWLRAFRGPAPRQRAKCSPVRGGPGRAASSQLAASTMVGEATPATAPVSASIETVVMVKGGMLGKGTWRPSAIHEVGGRMFFELALTDTTFARFLGLMTWGKYTRSPWVGNEWPDYLIQLRKKRIDQVIADESRKAIDPLGDQGAQPKRARREVIGLVPEIVEVVIPEVNDSIGEHTMAMLSTDSNRKRLALELTDGNLDYLACAIHAKPPVMFPRASPKKSDVPYPDVAPNVRMRSCRGRMLYTKWLDGGGVVRSHSHMVPPCTDEVLADQFAKNVAIDIQKFYADNCVEEYWTEDEDEEVGVRGG